MSRTLSSTALASANAQETDEVWLVLLTIDHDDLEAPLRVVNNNANVTSNGQEFIAFPFEIELPGEDPDQPATARLKIDNVDRRVVQALRSIASAPTVTIQVILASAPNTVEFSFEGMTLRNAIYDANAITAELTFEQILTEPIAVTMNPQRFPGMF